MTDKVLINYSVFSMSRKTRSFPIMIKIEEFVLITGPVGSLSNGQSQAAQSSFFIIVNQHNPKLFLQVPKSLIISTPPLTHPRGVCYEKLFQKLS